MAFDSSGIYPSFQQSEVLTQRPKLEFGGPGGLPPIDIPEEGGGRDYEERPPVNWIKIAFIGAVGLVVASQVLPMLAAVATALQGEPEAPRYHASAKDMGWTPK